MDELTFERKLNELIKEIGPFPEPSHKKLITLAQETQKYQKELKQSLGTLQDSLDYLRVCVKYLLFDLEATRRENSYMKKLLEEKE